MLRVVSIPDRVLGIFRRTARPTYQESSVSIPDRVLGIFRQLNLAKSTARLNVSIPDRVLGIFRPSACVQQLQSLAVFQSLIGF